MQLIINTSLINEIEVSILKNNKVIANEKLKSVKKQAELLLLTIDKLLIKNKLNINDISLIKVHNYGGTFTGLRIGVVTANSLAYALNIPIKTLNDLKEDYFKYSNKKLVIPFYSAKPNIG